MIRKSAKRFSDKIMRKQKIELPFHMARSAALSYKLTLNAATTEGTVT